MRVYGLTLYLAKPPSRSFGKRVNLSTQWFGFFFSLRLFELKPLNLKKKASGKKKKTLKSMKFLVKIPKNVRKIC